MNRFVIVLAGGMLWAILTCPALGLTVSRKPQPSDNRAQSQTIFQARGGTVFDGDITFKEDEHESSLSTDGRSAFVLGVEFPSRGWIATGIEVDIDQVSFGKVIPTQTLWGVSVTARRTLKPGILGAILRPGLALGYGRMDVPYSNGIAGMFLIRGFLEFDLVSKNHIGLSCEFGVMGAPFGKISGQTGTFSADVRPVVRLGVLLK